MHLVENSWLFGSFLRRWESSGDRDPKEILQSAKAKKLGIKLITSGAKTGTAFLSAASLFFGWHLSPLIVISSSTVSLAASVTCKVGTHSELTWGERSIVQFPAGPSLPA
jgi:hypothetical protein